MRNEETDIQHFNSETVIRFHIFIMKRAVNFGPFNYKH